MGNRLNKPYMEVEGNQTTRKTSIDTQNTGGTYKHTRRPTYLLHTDIFLIVVFGSWEVNCHIKIILTRLTKTTDANRYGTICP